MMGMIWYVRTPFLPTGLPCALVLVFVYRGRCGDQSMWGLEHLFSLTVTETLVPQAPFQLLVVSCMVSSKLLLQHPCLRVEASAARFQVSVWLARAQDTALEMRLTVPQFDRRRW